MSLINDEKGQFIKNEISTLNLGENLAFNTILSIYKDNEILEKLINISSKILHEHYRMRKISEEDRCIIIFTFSWLVFENYNGNFWDIIRQYYSSLYKEVDNQQFLEKLIREIISEQEKYLSSRHITHVLVHAGIPRCFLSRFYDFLFDIYEINFNYQLRDESIEEILLESIEGLAPLLSEESNNSQEDSLVLNVTKKTYVLIKSTKLGLLHYKQSYVSILKRMLEIIDSWYWSLSFEEEKYSPILIDEFKKWVPNNQKTPLGENQKVEYISKPRYKFDVKNKTIKIEFPQYRLKGINTVDFDSINVECVVESKTNILDKNEFKIIEKIGFNTIEIKPQTLSFISSNMLFNINQNNEPIISTNDSLNREFIIFNSEGNEIDNNKEYEGLVYVVFSKGKKFKGHEVKIISDFVDYDIAVFEADKKNIYACGDTIIYFSNMLQPGVYGNEANGVVAYMNNRKKQVPIQVFLKVNNFVFESELDSSELIVSFNKKQFSLNDLNFHYSKRGPFYNYNILIEQECLSNNLNNISIYDKKQNLKLIRSENFLIDENLTYKLVDTENSLKKGIRLMSSFTNANVSIENFDFSKHTYFSREFRLGNNCLEYQIDPFIKRYKWNVDDDWQLLTDMLELGKNKRLFLSSTNNIVKVLNKDKIDFFNNNLLKDDSLGYSSLDISFLFQLKHKNIYVFLNISDSTGMQTIVRIYLQQAILHYDISLNIDGSFIFAFSIVNFLPDTLEMKIYDDKEKMVLNLTLKDQQIFISKLEAYKRYSIEIYEKANIFESIEERMICSFNCYLKDATKLEGKKFIIKEAGIYFFDNKNNIQYNQLDIKPVLIEVKNKIDKVPHKFFSLNVSTGMVYRCKLYKLSYSGDIIPFSYLNEIYIEIISKKTARIINFEAEDKDGGGLLLLGSKRYLIDADDEREKNIQTIDYLIINSEGDKYD